jgi:hypothetical protein
MEQYKNTQFQANPSRRVALQGLEMLTYTLRGVCRRGEEGGPGGERELFGSSVLTANSDPRHSFKFFYARFKCSMAL